MWARITAGDGASMALFLPFAEAPNLACVDCAAVGGRTDAWLARHTGVTARRLCQGEELRTRGVSSLGRSGPSGFQTLVHAGDDGRPEISASQPRLIAGYASPHGWWTLGDIRYTRSWVGPKLESLDTAFEAGKMIARDTGVWLSVGTSFLDNPRQLGVNLGFRKLL
jgi:hypothetical protein